MNRLAAVFAAAGALLLGCSSMPSFFSASPSGIHPQPTVSAKPSPTPHEDLSGEWSVSYSWGCGSYSQAVWILDPDGTFYSPTVNRGGTWKADGREFRLAFSHAPFVTYIGTAAPGGAYLEGTMSGDDGSQGCWHADKKSPA